MLDKNIGNVDVTERVVFFLVVPEAVIAIWAQRQNLLGLDAVERHQADVGDLLFHVLVAEVPVESATAVLQPEQLGEYNAQALHQLLREVGNVRQRNRLVIERPGT